MNSIPVLVASALLFSVEATSGPSESDVGQATFVMEGVRNSRESLDSGRFEAAVVEVIGEDQQHRYQLISVFDAAMSRLRFTRLLEGDPVVGHKRPEGHYIRTPDRSIHCVGVPPPSGTMKIDTPGSPPSDAVAPFDVRMIGLANYDHIRMLMYLGETRLLFPDFYKKIYQQLSVLESIETTSEGLTKLSWWEDAPGAVSRRLWVDTRAGYTPVRLETEDNLVFPSRKTIQETEWTEVSGIYLPSRWKARCGSESLVITFRWSDVNESIPDEEFDIPALQIPGLVTMVDARLGTPVVTGVYRGSAKPAPDDVAGRESGFSGRNWMLLINLLFVVCLVTTYVVRLSRAK